MARARNIKPGLFKNEILGVADPLYTLLFEGLWLLADREGRLEDRPLRIKAEIFPYREGINMDAMLGWLKANGFIHRYRVGGLAFIEIDAFTKHQNPHKNEPESELPGAVDADAEEISLTPEKIGSARADSLSLDSGFRIADTATSDRPPSPPPQTKKRKPQKTALPEGFGISERVRTWAATKGYGRLDEHIDAFRRKAAAKGYEYANWDDAFMEAIREDWAKLRGPKSAPAGERAVASSSEAAKTAEYLAAREMTPEQKEAAERARRAVMASIKVVRREAA